MEDVVPSDISLYCYADDHVIKKSFTANSLTEEQNGIDNIEKYLVDIVAWMDTN